MRHSLYYSNISILFLIVELTIHIFCSTEIPYSNNIIRNIDSTRIENRNIDSNNDIKESDNQKKYSRRWRRPHSPPSNSKENISKSTDVSASFITISQPNSDVSDQNNYYEKSTNSIDTKEINNNSNNNNNDEIDSNSFAMHITNFVAECEMPTDSGVFKMRSYTYTSGSVRLEPVVVINGDIVGKENVLVRVHDQCFTSEVFGSLRCDCKEQLRKSLDMISESSGIVIYLQQEGRGIGLANKIAAYSLQDDGMDTIQANHHLGFKEELREYMAVPDILKDLGIKSIRLITNNPYKIEQLQKLGVTISERVPIEIPSNIHNYKYLVSKRDKMNHFLSDNLSTEELNENGNSNMMSRTQNNNNNNNNNNHNDNINQHSNYNNQYYNDNNVNNNFNNNVYQPHPSEVSSTSNPTSYVFGRQTVLDAIAAMREGKVVVVVDDADRENEGDFIMAAELATPETIGFIVRYSSGVVCISLEESRLHELLLPPMVVNNEDPKQTAYSVSVDYKYGTTTGISAADRALTFNKLCDPHVRREEFQRPGHVFPLRYRSGGVLQRAGHTEASLDLSRLAGCYPGGVLAEVVNDDGSMMRLPELQVLSKRFGLVLTSVQDIIAYRLELEKQ